MKYHVRVNVKVERVSTTLRFTHDLSYLASNLLTHVVFYVPKHVKFTPKGKSTLRGLRLTFQCRVIFTFANKIEAMHEKSLVNAELEARSISLLSSVLFILPLFYLGD